MDIVEIRRRVKAVRKLLRRSGVDGLVVMGVENVRYLTGFRGHDSWVLVLGRSVVLVTDSRYTEQAKAECLGCRIVERKGSIVKEVGGLLEKYSDVKILGIEDSCSVALLKTLRKKLSVKLKPVRGMVENVRIIKSDDEVKLIRKASKIAFDAMQWALEQVKPPMTELELAALYEYRLRAYNAKVSFETIVSFGPNGSRNHHQPGKRKLRKNDTILLDFGANYEGYASDMTRCYAVGKVTPFFRTVYETVARAQRAAIDKVGDGVRLCEVDAAARAVIQEAGLAVYGHGTGHGLGLQVHELPYVTGTDKKGRLKAGQVITIEPGVYLPGKMGVRLEDDVLVTKTGGRVLSADKRFDVKTDKVPLL
ncbi:MAG: aminopeptidase P family protein [Planctomycetes bacterium]|nr:aminopeptidase P family protein [Planctomycetota bacterium]